MRRLFSRAMLLVGLLAIPQLSPAQNSGTVRLGEIREANQQTIQSQALPPGNLPDYVPLPDGSQQFFEPEKPITIDLVGGQEAEYSQQPIEQAYETRGGFSSSLDEGFQSSGGYVDPTFDPNSVELDNDREAPPFGDDNDPFADESDSALNQPASAAPDNISILNSDHHDVSILTDIDEESLPSAPARPAKPKIQQSSFGQWKAVKPNAQRPPKKDSGIRWVSATKRWWGHSSCDECQTGCQECCEPECCPKFWEHRTGLNGSFLYLHTTNIDLPYTTHVDGNTQAAVPLAPTNSLDPDYDPGFRVGFSYALDYRSSFTANYWFYESSATDSISLPGGTGFLRPELTHPNTLNAFADRLNADARYDIDFQMADANYKSVLWGGQDYFLNYVAGFRYANLDQDFDVVYTNNDVLTVDTEIDFDGYGPRLGLEGERLLGRRGFMVYGKGHANFLVGEFTSNYLQRNETTDVTQAHAGFEDDRIVTQLEYEMGFGWQNRCGTLRLMAGYYVAAWFNSVTTPSFIRSVQAGNYDNVDETLTFDGLTARAEVRW